MKKYIPIIFAVAVLAIGGGLYLMQGGAPKDDIVVPEGQTWAEYKNDAGGFSFQYRQEPDGYVVLDQLAGAETENPGVLAAVTLMFSTDQAELAAATGPREAPPTLNIAVIENPEKYTLQEWVEMQSGYSNLCVLFDSAQKVDIDGHEGVRFMSDGLYPLQNIVVAADDKVFVLIGAYLDTESQIYRDFDNMLVETLEIF